VEVTVPGGACTLRVRAVPLPGSMASALDQSEDQLRAALAGQQAEQSHADDAPGERGGPAAPLAALGARLAAAAVESGAPQLRELLRRAWQLGPKHVGPTMLLADESGLRAEHAELWGVPSASVTQLAKQQHHARAGAAGAREEGGEAEQVRLPLCMRAAAAP
jgi:ribosome assembly protein 1